MNFENELSSSNSIFFPIVLLPHSPMFAPNEYVDYYWQQRNNIFVSPSIDDPMKDSAYKDINGRFRIGDSRYGWNKRDKVGLSINNFIL